MISSCVISPLSSCVFNCTEVVGAESSYTALRYADIFSDCFLRAVISAAKLPTTAFVSIVFASPTVVGSAIGELPKIAVLSLSASLRSIGSLPSIAPSCNAVTFGFANVGACIVRSSIPPHSLSVIAPAACAASKYS